MPPIAFPSSQLAHSEIWDDRIRNGLANPRFKKKDLDERRSKVSKYIRLAIPVLMSANVFSYILEQNSRDAIKCTSPRRPNPCTTYSTLLGKFQLDGYPVCTRLDAYSSSGLGYAILQLSYFYWHPRSRST